MHQRHIGKSVHIRAVVHVQVVVQYFVRLGQLPVFGEHIAQHQLGSGKIRIPVGGLPEEAFRGVRFVRRQRHQGLTIRVDRVQFVWNAFSAIEAVQEALEHVAVGIVGFGHAKQRLLRFPVIPCGCQFEAQFKVRYRVLRVEVRRLLKGLPHVRGLTVVPETVPFPKAPDGRRFCRDIAPGRYRLAQVAVYLPGEGTLVEDAVEHFKGGRGAAFECQFRGKIAEGLHGVVIEIAFLALLTGGYLVPVFKHGLHAVRGGRIGFLHPIHVDLADGRVTPAFKGNGPPLQAFFKGGWRPGFEIVHDDDGPNPGRRTGGAVAREHAQAQGRLRRQKRRLVRRRNRHRQQAGSHVLEVVGEHIPPEQVFHQDHVIFPDLFMQEQPGGTPVRALGARLQPDPLQEQESGQYKHRDSTPSLCFHSFHRTAEKEV
ncbi:MAG: hypothetical protein BWY09_01991 [Candidatus Hydrogenedentes bacterium ADurb.Bin179]|nr:MAG: hypothetical protein BWY09_01991 [Candidatus Hydrogenedentes bacterium ADurb.Bin179]